jgi:H+/Cl- antiporter ClcA
MTGVLVEGVFGWRTLVAKILGTAAGNGGGLLIGLEGRFLWLRVFVLVHVCWCVSKSLLFLSCKFLICVFHPLGPAVHIAALLMHEVLQFFKKITGNFELTQMLFATACGAGLCVCVCVFVCLLFVFVVDLFVFCFVLFFCLLYLFFLTHTYLFLSPSLLHSRFLVGVAVTFGSPIGGVLFSIEVTATYYPLRNYYYSYFVAVLGGFLFRILYNLRFDRRLLQALLPTQLMLEDFAVWEMMVFIGLGVVLGALSALFVLYNHWVICARRWASQRFGYPLVQRYLFMVVVALLTGLLTFPGLVGDLISPKTSLEALEDLFTRGDMEANAADTPWPSRGLFGSLGIYLAVRFFLTPPSLTLPLPAGLFLPTMLVGALFGRLVGEFMKRFITDAVVPAGYAVVGAAAFNGGVTHTLSPGIIILEMTGETAYTFPVLFGVMCSVFVARIFSDSIYMQITKDKNMPFLPDLRSKYFRLTAGEIMDTTVHMLPRDARLSEIQQVLKAVPKDEPVPIVTHLDDPTLLGQVSTEDLRKHMASLRFSRKTIDSGGLKYHLASDTITRRDAFAQHHSVRGQHTLTRTVSESLFYVMDDMPDDGVSRDGRGTDVLVLPSEEPTQVVISERITLVHKLFLNSGDLRVIFVTKRGCLVGVLRRDSFKQLSYQRTQLHWADVKRKFCS